MKKNSIWVLWVLLGFTTFAQGAPLRSWKTSTPSRGSEHYILSDQTGSPWRLFLGADGGYAKYTTLNSALEGSKSGMILGGRALISRYWFSTVLDAGLGWEYISVKGTNPTGTQDTINTKLPYLDLSLRYRFGRYLQFGPEFQYSLGTDFALNTNVVSGDTNHGVYLGAQLLHEWERERKFRFGGRWLTPLSGTTRTVNQFQVFFQMGFDVFNPSEGQNQKHLEQINEYDIERASSQAPKEVLPMATPAPAEESTPTELEPIPVATPGPPEGEVQPEATPAEPAPSPEASAPVESSGSASKVLLTLGINDLPFGISDAKLPRGHVARIKNMGKYLGENSQYFKKLFIAAHTDERGSKERNLELSKTRANLVRDLLVEGGAPAGKIQAQGFGESKPIDKRHNEKAWAKNRRVELKFTGVSDSKIIKKALDQ